MQTEFFLQVAKLFKLKSFPKIEIFLLLHFFCCHFFLWQKKVTLCLKESILLILITTTIMGVQGVLITACRVHNFIGKGGRVNYKK
jgi:uncharacterized membrane protein